jgi:uncharacterized protein
MMHILTRVLGTRRFHVITTMGERMDWKASGSEIFLRIDPEEYLVKSLIRLSEELSIQSAAITSGVGMLMAVELGFFDTEIDDYKTTRKQGIFDVNSILGNISRRDNVAVPHVHIIFNDGMHNTYSGHVVEAQCHITMELFLSVKDLTMKRVKQHGRPATRIELR